MRQAWFGESYGRHKGLWTRMQHQVTGFGGCYRQESATFPQGTLAAWDIPKKRNWNTPGPDRFHKLLVEVWAFLAISESEEEYPGLAVEIFCLWMEHQEKKSKEKTVKYGPLLFELKNLQYPSCDVDRCNIIIDVPGGWSRDL